MSVQIETDLKDILSKIEQKLDNLQKDVTELKIGQTRLEVKIEANTTKIEVLDEKFSTKIDGLDKRLGNQEFLNRTVVVGLLLAILGGLAKLFGFAGNLP